MDKQYTAINLCAGIGIMSLAFEQAGFKVICNLIGEEKEKRIISENSKMSTVYFDEFDQESLLHADIMIGNFAQLQDSSLGGVSGCEQFPKDKIETFQSLLRYVQPKVFFFDINVRARKNNRLPYIIEVFERNGYKCCYRELNMREATGSPIRQQRGYLTALRMDINMPLLFHKNTVQFQSFEEYQEKDVDYTYDVKNERTIYECRKNENGLYVWKNGKYQRDEEINNVYRIPVLKSDECLRRITPRELARIKGIPDDYKLSVGNKSWLYRKLWHEPHMTLMSLMADELYSMLEKGIDRRDRTVEEERIIVKGEQVTVENNDIQFVKETHMMERRFDVFVSSTYEDLIEERKEVTQAILESDCVPVGMEMFPASSLEQWKFIKKVIDKSDIYLVIIAGKYGSEDESEKNRIVSYTEKEFDYALKQGKPILAFLVDDIGKLVRDKTEANNDKMECLTKFREKVKTGRLVKFYQNKDDLKAKVMGSLNQIKKQLNSGGWVRADEDVNADVEELKRTIFTLETEKEKLQKQIDSFLKKENEHRFKHEKMSTELDEMCQNIELFKKQINNLKVYVQAANK